MAQVKDGLHGKLKTLTLNPSTAQSKMKQKTPMV
jgi:hypothetical protein